MDTAMTKKICRICLCTNKTLRDLNKYLSDYILEICENTYGSSKHLCCTSCEDALRNNLDFRNKCRRSNQILQEWENNPSQERIPIESLHKLLKNASSEYEYDTSKHIEPLHHYNGSVDNDIIKEEIKDELFEQFENEDIDNEVHVKKVCKDVKNKRSKKEKVGAEVDKDARKELVARSSSEPYLSAQHRCEICYTVYKNEGLLQFHMKWHDLSADLSHECDVCSMRFATRSTLLKHKPNCHRGKFACKMCPLVTYQRQAMKAHYQKHQGKIYKCHCDRVFKHISSYMTHRRNVHASHHVCGACARSFVSELGLRDHTLKMHPAECKADCADAVRCEPCGLTFTSEQVYIVHVLNTDYHKDIAGELVACSVCGLTFEDVTQLKEHKRQNHARAQNNAQRNVKKIPSRKDSTKKEERINDVIECKLCGQTGAGSAWLYQHYRREHPAHPYEAPRGLRQFLCELCGQGFYKKLQLEEHGYVHSGLKPHRCETCHKAFRTKMSLKNHSERHAPPSRECPHCGKKFNSAANLSNHIRGHTGARRFVCLYCAKGFLHRAALREHTRGVHLHIRRERRNIK